ncbi:hypothetical protein DCAR_0102984 [Daucus carota subsp. sativus]|uniref:Uncharacterized protein n=1 Tax=Daucus carota subsp. sativus TaxID=79200 RepID=A0A166HFL9_DAUCS|nr:PREDICTED: uncharacterized protein LOC108193808 [Daucus carota subsp. sativus]WOG83806.1 hypothetical protein DCAR_0102984 [Daucus carota subsp. sativus]
MSPITILTLSLLSFSLVSLPPPSLAGESSNAYDLLESYNFPAGLLPVGVQGYDLDQSTGKFSLYLNGSCSFSAEGSYQLKYKSTISGKIAKNKLTNLSGISVKILFLWLNIVEVDRNGDEIELSVGFASAVFPVGNFDECPQCGCGLDCAKARNNGLLRKMKLNSFVQSS